MIRLRTLGALDLCGADGHELGAVLAQPKRAAVLVYLALATPRGPHRRDKLVALFWPEVDAERARNALSQAVHFLRRSLGADVLVSNNTDELSLETSDLWCDAVAFDEALDAGRSAEALELYRGELLEGFHVANAPEFERWLEAERSRLGARYVQAAEAVAAERERAGDIAASVECWRRLAARDPYSSRIALGLMRTMAAAGDTAGAVRHARVHETLLREELEVAPDPEVAALVRELQAGLTTERRRISNVAAPASPPGSTVDTRNVEPQSAPAPESERAVLPQDGAAGEPATVRRERGWRHRLARPASVRTAGLVALLAAAAVVIAVRREGLGASTPPIRSLAVLPFENLSGSSADQVLADGMHDALTSELARYPDVTVISRLSATHYKETNKRLPEIARELKVDAVVVGALLHEGGRIRISAQLVHGQSDRHLWADTYRRDLRDILTLQEEIAAAIAREVRAATAPVSRAQRVTTGRGDSLPVELYLGDLYARARHAEVSRSPIGMETATQYYRRAIERDSTFARAYAGLAENYALKAHYDLAPKTVALDSARLMAERAVALDSTLPEARTALGLALGNAGQFELAEREFRRAIDLSPSNAGARYWYGMLLVGLGRGPEALVQAERALELDPLSPQPAHNTKRAAVYLMTGQRPHMDLPVTERRSILEVESGAPWPRARDAVELAEQGRCDGARTAIEQARQIVPGDNMKMLTSVGQVYWLCDERARARALLTRMKRRPDAHDHGDAIGRLHIRFGEKDSAFVWLGRHRYLLGELTLLRGDHFLDSLRSDPRFDDLLLRIGVGGRRPGTALSAR